MSRGHRLGWVIGIVAAGGLVLGAASAIISPDDTPPSVELTGYDLADALSLGAITTWPVTDCVYLAEVEEGVAYCFDSVVSSEHDAWVLMERIRGNLPTVLDERVYTLEAELRSLSGRKDEESLARRNELIAELMPLLEEQGSQPGG